MDKVTITLGSENGSFQGKKVVILSQPVTLGRLMDNQEPQTATALRFNSKVVSRTHAKIWHQDGKFYIQDTKSSSGTFLNGERLSTQGTESRPFELKDGDLVKLGEDYHQSGAVHLCVFMRIKLPAGFESNEAAPPSESGEDNYVDVSNDNDVRATVDDEFNSIWNNLTADLGNPMKKLKERILAKAEAAKLQKEKDDHKSVFLHHTLNNSGSPSKDTSVTLIKSSQLSGANDHSPINTIERMMQDPNSAMNLAAKSPVDNSTAEECIQMIESLQWESQEVKDSLLQMAQKQDQQLIAFYRSLRGFPSSFTNVAAKYAKYAKKK